MKYQAILAKTTTDQIKSKIMSPEYVQLVVDVYMTPEQYAKFVTKYFEESFAIILPE